MENIKKNTEMLPRAKELRKNMTEQERRLWYCFLKDYPVRFYRQKIIESFIVDFCCSKARVIIEIDGSQHYEPENIQYDRRRTEVLEKYGFCVLRFSNRDINQSFQNVCEHIHNTVTARLGYNPYQK